MIVIGIDENGLGPQLGPLIVTGVSIEATQYAPVAWNTLGKELGLDDSKATSAFGKMGWCESVALAIAEISCGHVPRTADDLLDQIGYESVTEMQTRCPSNTQMQCWGTPLALPALGGDVNAGRAALENLSSHGIHLQRARSVVACVRYFNERLADCGSKLGVDLYFFEQLLLDAHAHHATPLHAICGMVGGIRRYRDRFRLLPPEHTEIVEEIKGRSAYRVENLGDIAFEVGSDANHLPVALASMLGKYVREIAMKRQNTFYQRHLPELRPASGYYDRVTQQFIADTEVLRGRLNIAKDCFRRQR